MSREIGTRVTLRGGEVSGRPWVRGVTRRPELISESILAPAMSRREAAIFALGLLVVLGCAVTAFAYAVDHDMRTGLSGVIMVTGTWIIGAVRGYLRVHRAERLAVRGYARHERRF